MQGKAKGVWMEWGIGKGSREQKRMQLFCKEREKRTGSDGE